MKLDHVQEITVELTTHCNSKCPQCPRFDERGQLHPKVNLQHLDIQVLRDQIDLTQLTNLRHVLLQGDKGDPAMHPDFIDVVEFWLSAPSRPWVTVNTNGSIQTAEAWQRLGQLDPRLLVMFSIDGLEDTNHLYRVGLDWRFIERNVKAYTAAGGRALWHMLLFQHNQHQIDSAAELAKSWGCEAFSYCTSDLPRFQGESHWPVYVDGQQTHTITPSDIITPYPKTRRLRSRPALPRLQDNSVYSCPWSREGKVYITHQGIVVPCCMMHFDTLLEYPDNRFEELTGGHRNQSLSYYTLSEIFDNPFYNNRLEESFQSDRVHFTCKRSCGSSIIHNEK